MYSTQLMIYRTFFGHTTASKSQSPHISESIPKELLHRSRSMLTNNRSKKTLQSEIKRYRSFQAKLHKMRNRQTRTLLKLLKKLSKRLRTTPSLCRNILRHLYFSEGGSLIFAYGHWLIMTQSYTSLKKHTCEHLQKNMIYPVRSLIKCTST